jgi:hypothetical protein
MAYPTGMLSLVLEDLDTQVMALKGDCVQVRNAAAADNTSSSTILRVFTHLRVYRAKLSALSSTPGLADYARAQKNAPGLDVVAEFNALMAAIDGVTGWIAVNFPTDGGGFLLERTLGANGPVERQFTPAQTAGFRTQLDTVIAAIT